LAHAKKTSTEELEQNAWRGKKSIKCNSNSQLMIKGKLNNDG